MSALSIRFSDAALDHATEALTIVDLDGLIYEGKFGTKNLFDESEDWSLKNLADRNTDAVLSGSPIFSDHSVKISSGAQGGGPYGIDANVIPGAYGDVTMACLVRKPALGTSGEIMGTVGSSYIAIAYSTNAWRFFNSQSGTTPAIAAVSNPDTADTDYWFVIGWGAALDYPNIAVGNADAMVAGTAGTTKGSTRHTTNHLKIGTSLGIGNAQIEVAWAAAWSRILDADERLAQYLRIKQWAADNTGGAVVVN